MKCFVINLERAAERRAHIDALFGRLGVSYERVSAIDGQLLDRAMLDRAPSGMGRAAIGNLLSHRRAWELVAASGYPYAAVFEDDIHASAALPQFLADGDWIPKGTDVVKIDTTLMSVDLDRNTLPVGAGFTLSRLRSTHWGTGAYILAAPTAVRLMAQDLVPMRPTDSVLFECGASSGENLVVFQIDPALCIQEATISNVESRPSSLPSAIADERDRQKANRKAKTIGDRIGNELANFGRSLKRRIGGRIVRKMIAFAGS